LEWLPFKRCWLAAADLVDDLEELTCQIVLQRKDSRLSLVFVKLLAGGVSSWEHLASDGDVPEGGLLPFGMVILALWP